MTYAMHLVIDAAAQLPYNQRHHLRLTDLQDVANGSFDGIDLVTEKDLPSRLAEIAEIRRKYAERTWY